MYCTNCGMKFEGKFCPVCGEAAHEVNADYVSAQNRVTKAHTIGIPPVNARDLRPNHSIPSGANIKGHGSSSLWSSKYVSEEQYFSRPRSTPVTPPLEAPVTPTPKSASEPKRTSPLPVILSMIGVIAFFCLLIVPSVIEQQQFNEYYESTYDSTPTAAPSYNAVTFPSSGYSVVHNNKERIAPFIVNLPADGEYYYMVLSNCATDRKEVSIYGHSGDSIEIDVPLGSYYLYYTSGTTWYGTKHKFGEDAGFYKADAVLNFYETSDSIYYEEITLYPVTNGNMDTELIDPDEFPA